MHILSRLRLRTKLAILTMLSILAVVASVAVASSLMHERMVNDRIGKLRAVIHTALGLAQSLENEVAAHRLSREQAIDQFRNAAHVIRFDDGYLTAWTTDGIVVAHGTVPSLEGKPTPVADTQGRTVLQLGEAALQKGDQGVVAYSFPRPGQTEPKPKIAYAARFAAWNMVFMSGVYVDDLDAAFRATLLDLVTTGGIILLFTLLTAWLINRDIVTSLGRLKGAMEHLAHNELGTEVPGVDCRDEVGAMAGAVRVFKQDMVRSQQIAAEREQERELAEATKRAALLSMAETIETEAKQALSEIGQRTHAMTETANEMSTSAARTGASAESAATAAAQALANAQTVASAAEQLTASIREIGGQVSQSAAVVGRAVEAGRVTREAISALNEQVGRIGTVADMISEIAARTNLLALNATIEAARAGDAGKGFAVVASEVKQLASQTAKSTEEISRHIGEVRTATAASVGAVDRIEETIGEINAIAGSIAAAVEQQGAATAEIARNVTETAAAANEMTSRTHEVSAEAEHTGRQAIDVRENTIALDSAMHDLHKTVVRLVRTATADADRRQSRRRTCLAEATLIVQGRSEPAMLHDIAEDGCHAITQAPCSPGQSVEVAVPHFGARITGTVVDRSEDGVHIAFTGDGLASTEADRISLTTVAELMSKAKEDHLAFVARVEGIVAARRNCRRTLSHRRIIADSDAGTTALAMSAHWACHPSRRSGVHMSRCIRLAGER